jgi:membrane protease YdiL (CAAX protease family)
MKWLSPILAYLTLWAGLFWWHNTWVALLGFHAVIIISLLIHKPNIPIALLFKSKNKKWIFLSVFLCGSSGIILYFLWPIFGIKNDLPVQLQSLGLTLFTWPVFIAYFSLVNPLIEEYFWRGFLGSSSKKLSISDPVYAGYHALVLWGKVHPFSIIFAVMLLTLISWSWRQIAREDDGLLAPVLGHVAADFSITLCVYWICK